MTDKKTEALKLELKRIRSIVGQVTGLDDDDEENLGDAYRALGLVIDSLAEQPAIPEGYALISVDALKAWGKYDIVRDACQYPLKQPEQQKEHDCALRRGGVICRYCDLEIIEANATALRRTTMNDKKTEALKLALDALESAEQTLREQSNSLHPDFEPAVLVETGLAIAAIKEALAEQPAQRKPWVGLTDVQIGQVLDDPNIAEAHQGHWRVLPFAFARAIEAKLKEKNT